MTSDFVTEATDSTWEQLVEKSEQPIVVMFYLPGCSHCKTMEPFFAEYAQEFHETIRFIRLNASVFGWIAQRYGIQSTPTFKFFCHGTSVRDMIGAAYPTLLRQAIEETLIYGEACHDSTSTIDYEISGYA